MLPPRKPGTKPIVTRAPVIPARAVEPPRLERVPTVATVEGHELDVTTKTMAVGEHYRALCSCDAWFSRPCGSKKKAVELWEAHVKTLKREEVSDDPISDHPVGRGPVVQA
jgi:hypothetical protein